MPAEVLLPSGAGQEGLVPPQAFAFSVHALPCVWTQVSAYGPCAYGPCVLCLCPSPSLRAPTNTSNSQQEFMMSALASSNVPASHAHAKGWAFFSRSCNLAVHLRMLTAMLLHLRAGVQLVAQAAPQGTAATFRQSSPQQGRRQS